MAGSMSRKLGSALLASTLLLSACGDRGAGLFATDPELENFTARQIYERGEYEIENRAPDDAAFYFSEVERLYPYSDYAKRALIMQAYAYHLDEDYETPQRGAAVH